MSRPIWKGSISFGLVNIPVTLFVAEKPSEGFHFHLLDSRNNARIHYIRVNNSTQKEVPWDKVVKAYEYKKGKYVVLDEKELEKSAPPQFQTVELQDFVDADSLSPIYFDKPYYLIPSKQGERGYVLLRETLLKENKIGIAKVVIRTRQYIAALFPFQKILVLNLLRYQGDLHSVEEYPLPLKEFKEYKITPQELEMAKQLVETMSRKWDPSKYHDESREVIHKLVQKKIKHEKGVEAPELPQEKIKAEGKVIDFMALLKKSIHEKEKRAKTNKTRVHKTGVDKSRSHKTAYHKMTRPKTPLKRGKKRSRS